jgi:type IV pilus assembly protein PilN
MYAYKVNFLPPQLQREGLIDFRRLILIGGTTLFLAIILGAYGTFLINYFSMKNELASAKQQISSLAPLVARVEGMVKERNELEAAIAEFDFITNKQAAWSNTLLNLLSDLPDITPIDLWLTNMDVLNKQGVSKTQNNTASADTAKNSASQPAAQTQAKTTTAKTTGQAQNDMDIYSRSNTIIFKGCSSTVPSIGVLIKNLNFLPYFSEVKLNKISNENKEIKFEITTTIRDDI